MANFARLPNQRKVLVFVVAGLFLGLLYWQFVFKKLRGDLDDARNQHDLKVAQSKKLDNDIKDFAELKPTINKLLERISENEAALPTEAELPAFFDTLNRKVIESGVQVNHWQQKPEEKVESFARVPVDVEIQGTFMQIKRFFALLVPHKRASGQTEPASSDSGDDSEGHERIVSIENLSIGDPQVRNHELVLTARFTANTFRKEEAALPAVAPGTKPAAAPAAVPAPAPMPPAATPAGAKARVEDSMKHDEQRSTGSAAKLKGGI
ncbi:MAG TPA: type 4a pilus biogenesis protein PilO [Kofleriaceae bacterium]